MLPLAVCSVISAGLIFCILVPQFNPDSGVVLISDVTADAAFDELRSLEHSTLRVQRQHEANNFETAYSGMEALKAFASRNMHDDKADRHRRHVSRVKISQLRSDSHSGSKRSALPLPP